MDITTEEQTYEEARLKKTIEAIHEQLSEANKNKEKAFNEGREIRKSFWESQSTIPSSMFDLNTIVDISQNIASIKREVQRERVTINTIKKLEKLKFSPYFGRVDFVEDDESNIEQIYVGSGSLINENYDMLIYDWRSPVCSLYYEHEIGKASYVCLEGEIKGDISLKRQFNILNGKMEYMFNNSLKINDDMLQKILSKSSDEKMKTIVNSIQMDQNKIIRDEDNGLLIVQGPAGSGKTSIALHRAAYILYRYGSRGINAENIVIFSPNDIFNDYISEILPELGEDNIFQTTFMEYSQKLIDNNMKLESSSDQMEYLLSGIRNREYELRKNCINFKGSEEFAEIIKRYVKYLETSGVSFTDMKYKEWLILSEEDLKSRFYDSYCKWPINYRFVEIYEDINEILKGIQKERASEVEDEIIENNEDDGFDDPKAVSRLKVMKEFKAFKEKIKQTLSLDVFDLYKKLMRDKTLFKNLSDGIKLPSNIEDIMRQGLKYIESGVIQYEDIAPIVYLKNAMGMCKDMSNIKYVIVDEAQDYSPFQYNILKQIFKKAGFTVLGDISQSINPCANTLDYNIIADIFKDKKSCIIKLNKSYRSTKEITEFTKAILGNVEIDGVARDGEKPLVVKVKNEEDRIDTLIKDVVKLKLSKMDSIGIICRTASKASKLYNIIKKCSDFEVTLIKKDDIEFKQGINIMPSYLAKGLEFDAVIVYDADALEYKDESERKLFYTVCTRALHVLHLYEME